MGLNHGKEGLGYTLRECFSGSEGQLWDRLRRAGVELPPEVWMDKTGECPLRKGSCGFLLQVGSGTRPAKDFSCSETLSLHSQMFCWERTQAEAFFCPYVGAKWPDVLFCV